MATKQIKEQKSPCTLQYHITEVLKGNRKFENIFQSLVRMILSDQKMIEKVNVNGKTLYNYKVLRQEKKHIIGMYEEINSFVSFIKDAAEGGSSQEMAFVLIGEPGNGKTFFVDYLSKLYREFIAQAENNRFSFRFKNLDKIGGYGKIKVIESQTYEDPMILAMNIYDEENKNRDFLKKAGASNKQIDIFYQNYRPLGADTYFILNEIKEFIKNDLSKLDDFIEIFKIPISESRGVLTGKYAAKDKITSSAVDLLGDESITRLLHITDPSNPYRFDLRRGALGV